MASWTRVVDHQANLCLSSTLAHGVRGEILSELWKLLENGIESGLDDLRSKADDELHQGAADRVGDGVSISGLDRVDQVLLLPNQACLVQSSVSPGQFATSVRGQRPNGDQSVVAVHEESVLHLRHEVWKKEVSTEIPQLTQLTQPGT